MSIDLNRFLAKLPSAHDDEEDSLEFILERVLEGEKVKPITDEASLDEAIIVASDPTYHKYYSTRYRNRSRTSNRTSTLQLSYQGRNLKINILKTNSEFEDNDNDDFV